MADLHTRAMWGTFWSYVQNWAARGLTLVTFFVLARLLNPIEFGAFAVAAVFLTLAEVFVEQGLGHAIVQRPILEEKHISTAFWVTLSMGCALALLTFVLARPVSLYFDNVEIGPIAIALTPIFILMALSSIPAALLRRELKYKVLAKRSLLANVISGVVAIVMAANGFGVWSFVGQQIAFHSIGVIVLWKNETWRPRFIVSLVHLSQLGDFSIKMILVKLLDFFETRVIDLVVARQLGLNALGSYSLATRAYQAVVQLIAAPVWESTNSSFARMQQDQNAMRKAFLDMNVFVAIIVVPVFLLMSVTASGLIPGVFGVKWMPSVTTFQVLCLLGAIRAISFISGSLLQAGGRAGLSLGIAALRAVLSFCALYYLIGYGLVGVACSILIGQILVLPLSYLFIWRFQEIGIDIVLKKIFKPVLVAIFAALVGFVTLKLLLEIMQPLLAGSISLIIGWVMFLTLLVVFMPRTLSLYLNSLPNRIRVVFQQPLSRVILIEELIGSMVYAFALRISSWLTAKPKVKNRKTIVLVPADASSVGGSLGDQALLGGLASGLIRYGIDEVRIVCRPGTEMPVIPGLNIVPIPIWFNYLKSNQLVKELRNAHWLVVMGADTLDGFYSRKESLVRLLITSFNALDGSASSVMSFSFNDNPDSCVSRAFRRLPSSVNLCARDAISLQRIVLASGKVSEAVADLGFLLEPKLGCDLEINVGLWCASHRAAGRKVLAWNVSPHCLKLLSQDLSDTAVNANAAAIARLLTNKNVAVVLVPHDFRGHASDSDLLERIDFKLANVDRTRLMRLKGPYSAEEIKATCAHFDFLFTGRMHLMVAALGMGVPAAAIEYQGKFSGLFQHFGLGSDNAITPIGVCNPLSLYEFVADRLDQSAITRNLIRTRLPDVLKLSERNFINW